MKQEYVTVGDDKTVRGERAKRASFEEDENTRDESREMATDIMATSTTELTLFHSIRFKRSFCSCFNKNAPGFGSVQFGIW